MRRLCLAKNAQALVHHVLAFIQIIVFNVVILSSFQTTVCALKTVMLDTNKMDIVSEIINAMIKGADYAVALAFVTSAYQIMMDNLFANGNLLCHPHL